MEDKRWERRNSSRSSQYRKPPRGNLQPTVPKWERDFCEKAGGLSWKTLLQMKQYLDLDKGVLKWDDCAGKEAFDTAKTRYWIEINGFPCDMLPPNPDLYIDEIDWDAQPVDEKLEDLESLSVVADMEGHHEPVIIFSEEFMQSHSMQSSWNNVSQDLQAPTGQRPAIVSTGWGDEAVNHQAALNQYPDIVTIDWGDEVENHQVLLNQYPTIACTGRGDDEENHKLLSNQNLTVAPTNWGDKVANLQVPFNHYPDIQPTGWGDEDESLQVPINQQAASSGNMWPSDGNDNWQW